MSLSVSVPMNAVNAMPIPLAQGARVVLQAKPTYWTKRGTFRSRLVRSARSASASCSPASRSSNAPSRPKGSSMPSASARFRSCPAGRARHRSQLGRREGRGRELPPSLARRARRETRARCREPARCPRWSRPCSDSTATPRSRSSSSPAAAARSRSCCPSPTRRWSELWFRCRTPVVSAIGHEAGQSPARPRRRRPRIHPDRRRQAGRAGRTRGDRPRGRRPRPVAPGRACDALESERSGLRALVSRPVMADPVALVRVRRHELATLRSARGDPPRDPAAPRCRRGRAPPSPGRRPLPAVHPRAGVCRGAASRRPHRHGP